MVCNDPIGIFDSGLGGISIANAITHRLPNEKLVYIADSAHAPYGDKSDHFIYTRCRHMVDFLIKHNAKMIIVACNTATLSCIDKLRQEYTLPFVGVEPGIKPAILSTKSGKVGVLATKSSLNSEKYQKLATSLAADKDVFNQACIGLVEQIEKLDFDSADTKLLLKKYIAPLLLKGADQLVLGCTHYPFVYKQIAEIVGDRANIIDTSESVATQAIKIATKVGLSNTIKPTTEIYSSLLNDKMHDQIKTLWNTNSISIYPLN